MLEILAFFKGIPTAFWVGLALILALLGAFLGGEHRVQGQWNADKAAKAKVISQVQTAQTGVSAAVNTQYIKTIHQALVKGDTIKQKVPVYVPIQADAQCIIPNGFVSVWNSANSGSTLPDVPDTTVHEASGVKLSEVAAQHTTESTYTKQLETQVNGLIDWIEQESKVTKEVK